MKSILPCFLLIGTVLLNNLGNFRYYRLNHKLAWGLPDSITTIDDAIPSFPIRVLYRRHFFRVLWAFFLESYLAPLDLKLKAVHDLADSRFSTNCRVYDSSKRQSSFFAPFFKVSQIPTRSLLFANSSAVYIDSSRTGSVQRVPKPDPIPGISFATRPDPIQF